MFQPKAAFDEIAQGDADAVAFMASFYLYAHSRDDLIDRDKPPDVPAAVGFDLGVLREFAKNPFFQVNQDFLWPVILTSSLAYIASEKKRCDPNVVERITAQVLKSEYLNVFLAVAFLKGGFDHSVKMNEKYRLYSFDVENPVKVSG